MVERAFREAAEFDYDFIDRVCLGALDRYFRAVRTTRRYLSCPSMLPTADKCREQAHNRLLEQTGLNRDDERFAIWLSVVTEAVTAMPSDDSPFICPRANYCGRCQQKQGDRP